MTENTFYYNKNINNGLPFIPEVLNTKELISNPIPDTVFNLSFRINSSKNSMPEIIYLNMYDIFTKPMSKTLFTVNNDENPKIEILNMYDLFTRPLPKSLFVIVNNKNGLPYIYTSIVTHEVLESKYPSALSQLKINIDIQFEDNKYEIQNVPVYCIKNKKINDMYTGSFENTNINSIEFSNSIEIIGMKAFNKCDNLKEVEISENCYYEENSFPDSTVIKYLK